MPDFATRLRELRKRRGLRQVDLAESFGLAQTTIANYEKKLRFPDERMLGRFADFFDVSLDFLLGRSDSMRAQTEPSKAAKSEPAHSLSGFVAEYLQALRLHGFEAGLQLIEEATRDGLSLRQIYLEVLEPALKETGSLWERGELLVGQEHAVSEATQRIMSRIFPVQAIPAADSGRSRCLCLAVSREEHFIGARMVADFLRLAGWDVVFPGANLSIGHVIQMLEEGPLDLLAISVTLAANVSEAQDLIQTLRQKDSLRYLRILVGGQAFLPRPGLWQEIGADGMAENADSAVETADKLVRRWT